MTFLLKRYRLYIASINSLCCCYIVTYELDCIYTDLSFAEGYPDVYNAGGEKAVKNLSKMHDKQRAILNSKPAPKKSFEEFKKAREQLGLKSTKKDYQDYLVRMGEKSSPAPKKATPAKTKGKRSAVAKK